jgi:hypothetical protein
MGRVHLRGHANILKRVPLHTGPLNLGLLMRTLCGVGHAAEPPRPCCGALRRPVVTACASRSDLDALSVFDETQE